MRAIKVIVKEHDCYKTHLIDLGKVLNIVCTYPMEEAVETNVTQDVESAISNQKGQKIEFVYESNQNIEFDLEVTPAKFIIYDDYGNELDKTDDLESVEEAILLVLSNEDPESTKYPLSEL